MGVLPRLSRNLPAPADMFDLILPRECGGCGAPATRWCSQCAAALDVHHDHPYVVNTRIDPGVPVWGLGRYAGVRRHTIIALKERGRTDLIAPLARALAVGIHRLISWGILDTAFTIVPAPTRAGAARRRGGDPVSRIATAASAANPDITVARALRTAAFVRDSAGLTSAAREKNIVGKVRFTRKVRHLSGEVVLVDDVVTTGATAREAVQVLQNTGIVVRAVIALAYA